MDDRRRTEQAVGAEWKRAFRRMEREAPKIAKELLPIGNTPTNEGQARELGEIKDPEERKRAAARAVMQQAKARKFPPAEVSQEVQEEEAERKAGELLKSMNLQPGRKTDVRIGSTSEPIRTGSLPEGISRKESMNWQLMAEVPEEEMGPIGPTSSEETEEAAEEAAEGTPHFCAFSPDERQEEPAAPSNVLGMNFTSDMIITWQRRAVAEGRALTKGYARWFRFQPFESRVGRDEVIGVEFAYEPSLVAVIRSSIALHTALAHRRWGLDPAYPTWKHGGGWLKEHRCWFVEPGIWDAVKADLEEALRRAITPSAPRTERVLEAVAPNGEPDDDDLGGTIVRLRDLTKSS